MRTLLIALMMTLATQAGAYCSEPSIYLSTPTKPSVPWCVNTWDNTHTCDEWVIQQYYSELDNYRNEVDAFINALNNYVEEAVSYAECRASQIE